jgi:ribosomal protein S18 acetylase RimI-like enzyme
VAIVITPDRDQVLAFCAQDPVERVFIEEMARRGGRFTALADDGELSAVAYIGFNVVPSGRGCDAFAGTVARRPPRMIIGDETAVGELWDASRDLLPEPLLDRPGQPVFVCESPPEPGETCLRAARIDDLDLLVPACAAAHEEELGADPTLTDPGGFRRRTRVQVEESRSWLWAEDGVIMFKAEASAWTPRVVQLQQVWVDPQVRGRGYAQRGLRDLFRLLLRRVEAVCLFARAENATAIHVYEAIGMRRVGAYRSLLF